jgi:ATP-binding cassette, subfamily B (MDR/TAP), member 1
MDIDGTGERDVMRLTSRVYSAVSTLDMEWFDTKTGGEDPLVGSNGEGLIGAGGLMAKFNR